MSKQILSDKKQKRCEAIAGRAYRICYANGTRLQHGHAECWFGEGEYVRDADVVNYKTGEWRPYVREGQLA
jgi:hypothetical protein